MASNLTRNWIQYLKNNQIAALQSDPKSGKINYKRKVTASDVVDFLQNGTDYDDKAINQAIDRVVGSRSGDETSNQEQPADTNLPSVQNQQPGNLATNEPQMRPGSPNSQEPHKPPLAPPSAPSKYASTNQDATDVEPRYGPRPALGGGRKGLPAPATDTEEPQQPAKRTGGKVRGQVSQTPNAIRKRQARANRKGLNEDFKDDPGEELSEKEVESIFRYLNKASPSDSETHSKVSGNASGTAPQNQVNPQEVRTQELEKIKTLIVRTLTPEQRKQLWDALKGATLYEAIIKKYEAEEVFKDVINQSRSNYGQSKITLDQLKDAWAKAGYPDDTDDIGEMLQGMGYDSETVSEVINNVIGNEDEEDSSESRHRSTSNAIVKIAAYIKKAGLTDEITQFMQENFAEELKPKQSMWQKAKGFGKNLFGKKATNEDVKQIFTLMLKENINIVKTIEYAKLGRNKK
jgi:hypothetical protein